MKQNVRIHIESMVDGLPVIQDVQAQMYQKEDSIYYRYPEQEEQMGKTTALLKVQEDQIKMNRHGDVEAEQTFEVGKELPGFFHFPQGRMKLRIQTQSIEQQLEQGIGTIKWSYDGWSEDTFLGHFKLQLTIQEES